LAAPAISTQSPGDLPGDPAVRLEASYWHLADILETMPGGVVVLDAHGMVHECNSEAMSLLNQPLIGCSWSVIARRELRGDGNEDGELRLRDGRWLSLARRPLASGGGEVLLLADVSDTRRMTELRQRQARLTAIGEMTAGFAHQVRTPLASALLHVSQIDTAAPGQARVAARLRDRLETLGRMVDDMLGFAAGARPGDETIDVDAFLADVSREIGLQLEPATSLGIATPGTGLVIAANREALKGAILNLVLNAEQACRGRADIELAAARVDGIVHLSVGDNGPGIDADILPRLFDPFFTTRPQGTGLGLAVVRSVAAAHGGDVFVETSARGSRFTITLPLTGRGDAHD